MVRTAGTLVALLSLAVTLATRAGDDPAPPTASTAAGAGKTATVGRVPTEVEEQLRTIAKSLRPAIFLVGHPGRGHGTAFVISRKHRLLATAAHVADHAFEDGQTMLAVPAGTAQEYRVENVWYHPGIVRELDEMFYARSDSPSDGPVAYRVPDVAVLQLSADGPELPDAVELATDNELKTLDGKPLAILGYAGRTDHRWPTATGGRDPDFLVDIVSRTLNDWEDASAPWEKRHWVWHWGSLGPGSSGAPLFLPNGHVFAIDSMEDTTRKEESTSYRADCLRELLLYHQIGEMAGKDNRELRSRADWGPDPNLYRFRNAVALIRKAREQRRQGNYAAAGRLCNEALQVVPGYAAAVLERSKVYLAYCGTYWTKLKPQQRERYARWAYSDTKRSIDYWNRWTEAFAWQSQAVVYLDYVSADRSEFRANIEDMGRLLTEKDVQGHERAYITNCRAQCYLFLKDYTAAEQDYDESIRLDPEEPRWYLNRAIYWEFRKQPDRAAEDREMASELIKQRAPQSK